MIRLRKSFLFLNISMKLINLIVAAVSCLTISGCKYSFFAQCIKPLPNDSKAFGNALAVNEHYLAGVIKSDGWGQERSRKTSYPV